MSRVLRLESQYGALQQGYAALEEDSQMRLETLEVRWLCFLIICRRHAYRCNKKRAD